MREPPPLDVFVDDFVDVLPDGSALSLPAEAEAPGVGKAVVAATGGVVGGGGGAATTAGADSDAGGDCVAAAGWSNTNA